MQGRAWQAYFDSMGTTAAEATSGAQKDGLKALMRCHVLAPKVSLTSASFGTEPTSYPSLTGPNVTLSRNETTLIVSTKFATASVLQSDLKTANSGHDAPAPAPSRPPPRLLDGT
ncbi:hypothetical protein TSOC_012080 [Tetrabaena socialis]|uniref:FAS1 domain-containing protein n=1 Tax=Tetrabaena socialis TaxID=47790 RepID=A0A2J7ZNY5_9CHLO|nr:hypothetical protein TSOC_012080 [Tetrabaena socialis]|eukprot:PNH01977.1 hypothetical protein TSOC_012080 [Tetrabaena socialis]